MGEYLLYAALWFLFSIVYGVFLNVMSLILFICLDRRVDIQETNWYMAAAAVVIMLFFLVWDSLKRLLKEKHEIS